MCRVLVLGCTGMLGHMVARVLSKEPSLDVDGSHRLDRFDPLYFEAEQGAEGLRALMKRRGSYKYIVNAIGVTHAKINTQNPESVRCAIMANALFPHELAAVAAEVPAGVIHISTDGVFSGRKGPYLEDAPHDCTTEYAKTKSLGEVRRHGVLTIRCSIIGPDPIGRRGLLEWFLAQPDGASVMGYTDHGWNGVTTLQFAQLCRKIIVEDRFAEIWSESPVHHFCPNKPVSKYELLRIFESVFQKRVEIIPSCAGDMPVRRVLATHYHSLKHLFDQDLDMTIAVETLAGFTARSPW